MGVNGLSVGEAVWKVVDKSEPAAKTVDRCGFIQAVSAANPAAAGGLIAQASKQNR